MAIFRIAQDQLEAVPETNFGSEGILERKDLQRMLREHIAVLDEQLMVIAEEFGDWLDSSRRIDLLCIDSNAKLVVVELKRDDDGGHMELQALRYAAMVSTMTFEQLVDTYANYKNASLPDRDKARSTILQFLGWNDVDEEQFAQDTRIVLAAADFSKELTTAVMWLNEHNMSIRCVRMRPHKMPDGTVVIDVQQLIPLPEAEDFQTTIGIKKQTERKERHDLRWKFWDELLRYAKDKSEAHANRRPTTETWLSGGIGRYGFSLNYTTRKADSQVSLWISLGTGQGEKNKVAFKALEAQKGAIEADFGGSLEWLEQPDADSCLIRYVIPGGYKSSQKEWPEIIERLVDAMVRLDRAMRGRVAALKF